MSQILSFHPAYALLRNPYERGTFRVDLDRFKRLLTGNLKPKPVKLVTNPTVKDIEDLINEGLPIACDIETRPESKEEPWTGKDPTRAKLKSIGLGNKKWGLSFLWSDRSWPIIQVLRELFATRTIIGHNIFYFDQRILGRYGFRIKCIEDTRDARRALSSTSKLSLAYLSSLYNDTNPWKEGEEDDDKGLVFTDDLEKLKKYNAQDCFETAVDWDGICNEPEWLEPRVQRLYEIHKKTSQLAAELHTNGFAVDIRERRRLGKELEEIYEEKEQAFLHFVNLPGMRCTPNDLRKLLYKRHETDNIRRFSLDDPIGKERYSATGKIKVDLNSLLLEVSDPLRATDDLIKVINLYWQAESVWKMRSTYVVSKKISHAIGRDRRIRPSWNSCGTDTGRWSCADPNLQNLSAKDRNDTIRGKLPDVRKIYVAAPGKLLIHYDKSQLELRVRAIVMGDRVLESDLESGDVYGMNAKDWFGLDSSLNIKKEIARLEHPELLSPEELLLCKRLKAARFNCKTGHLASQYGAGIIKVHQNMLKEDRNAKYIITKNIHEGFRKRYYQTVKFWEEEFARVKKLGYSETLLLNRRRIYAAEPSPSDTANYPIQGTAADIITLEFLALRDVIKKKSKHIKMLSHEHDAITIEAPVKYKDYLLELFEEVSGRAKYVINGRECVFPIESKAGKSWDQV